MTSLNGYLKQNLLKYSIFSLSLAVFFAIFTVFLSIVSFDNLVNKVNSASTVTIETSAFYYLDEDGKLLGTISYTFSSDDLKILSHYNTKLPFVGLSNISVNGIDGTKTYTLFENKYSTDIDIQLDQQKITNDNNYEVQLSFRDDDFLANGRSSFTFPVALENSLEKKFTLELHKNWSKAQVSGLDSGIHQRLGQSGNLRISIDKPDETAQIYVLLGDTISYEYDISQTLSNVSDNPRFVEIPLPFSDSNSISTIDAISPTDFITRTDSDGNVLLGYTIDPNKSLDITTSGELSLIQENEVKQLDASELLNYLGVNDYWDISDETKILLDSQYNYSNQEILTTSLTSTSAEITHLLDVINTILDDKVTINNVDTTDNASGLNIAASRYTAQQALESGSISALNYSDIVLAIFREYNIPSRQVVGYVTNVAGELSDGFVHSWAQYWTTDKGWMIFDPAYHELTGSSGNSQNIIDHIPLIVRSQNPLKPNTGILQNGSINIAFTNVISSVVNRADINFESQERKINETNGIIVVNVSNTGNTIINGVYFSNNENIDTKTDKDNLLEQGLLLPGQSASIEMSVPVSKEDLTNDMVAINGELKVNFTDGTTKNELLNQEIQTIKPWWWDYSFVVLSTLLPIFISLGIIYIYDLKRKKNG